MRIESSHRRARPLSTQHSALGTPWLLLLPSLAVIGLFLLGGVGFAFAQSLGLFPLLGESEISLRHYRDVLGDPDFIVALLLSLRIAAVSTGIALVLSVGMALMLRRRLRGDGVLRVLFQLPLPIPHLVGAVGITFLITQSGLLARLLFTVGIIRDRGQFPLLVADRFGIGIVLVYVWKEVPFITLLLLAALAGIGDQYEEAARTLGASAWQRFRFVLLPLLLPAMLSASLIVFAFTFGAFEVPYVMGRTYPKALPIWAYERFNDVDLNQRPEALAVSVLIALLAAIVVVAYGALSRRILARGR
jgi:putative spermidine/putrescine transport system permease protein